MIISIPFNKTNYDIFYSSANFKTRKIKIPRHGLVQGWATSFAWRPSSEISQKYRLHDCTH